MAEKLGFLNQWMFGDWAERAAINRNADTLSNVEASVGELRALLQRQSQEILQLRAMFMGVVEVLNETVALDEAELERAIKAAYAALSPPPPDAKPSPTDPYRGIPNEPTPAEVDAAKALLSTAQGHHFSKRFTEARAVYQQIVDQYANTKQATTAAQQLENLRKA